MIEIGERVECIERSSPHYKKRGEFVGFLANGFKVRFDDGTSGLFLANSLKKDIEEREG